MKQKSNLSKVAKIATGAVFLFLCLLNLKTVVKNNGRVEKSDSNVANAKLISSCFRTAENHGDCTKIDSGYMCADSWIWHDCWGTTVEYVK